MKEIAFWLAMLAAQWGLAAGWTGSEAGPSVAPSPTLAAAAMPAETSDG